MQYLCPSFLLGLDILDAPSFGLLEFHLATQGQPLILVLPCSPSLNQLQVRELRQTRRTSDLPGHSL